MSYEDMKIKIELDYWRKVGELTKHKKEFKQNYEVTPPGDPQPSATPKEDKEVHPPMTVRALIAELMNLPLDSEIEIFNVGELKGHTINGERDPIVAQPLHFEGIMVEHSSKGEYRKCAVVFKAPGTDVRSTKSIEDDYLDGTVRVSDYSKTEDETDRVGPIFLKKSPSGTTSHSNLSPAFKTVIEYEMRQSQQDMQNQYQLYLKKSQFDSTSEEARKLLGIQDTIPKTNLTYKGHKLTYDPARRIFEYNNGQYITEKQYYAQLYGMWK